MRVHIVSTHRADVGHYAPLRKMLGADARFELVDVQPDVVIVLGRVEPRRCTRHNTGADVAV